MPNYSMEFVEVDDSALIFCPYKTPKVIIPAMDPMIKIIIVTRHMRQQVLLSVIIINIEAQ